MKTNTQQEVTGEGNAPRVNLICMSFDGDYVTEGRFATIKEAWERSNDMGSRWYFYPFHFVTTASGKTIKDTPEILEHLKGKRTNSVAKHFEKTSKSPEAQNADAETFAFLV